MISHDGPHLPHNRKGKVILATDRQHNGRLDLYRPGTAADVAGMSGLRAAEAGRRETAIAGDLSPLSGLTALGIPDCSGTPVSDLSPLSGLTALEILDCAGTQVSDLSLVSGLKTLRS